MSLQAAAATLDSNAPLAPRPPWPLTLASLVAIGLLSLTGRSFAIPPLLGLALLGTYAFDVRLANRSWAPWMVRVAVFTIVVFANVTDPATAAGHPMYRQHYVHALGQLLAAELVIQAWRERPLGGPRMPVMILLSGLVFLTACNTFDQRSVYYAVQMYFFALTLGFCGFGAVHGEGGPGGWGRHAEAKRGWESFRVQAVWIGLVAWLLANFLGTQIRHQLYSNRNVLSNWVAKMSRTLRSTQSSSFAGSPKLGPRQSMPQDQTRILHVVGHDGPLHLRGLTFNLHVNGLWKPPPEERRTRPRDVDRFAPKVPATPVTVTRLTDGSPLLFAPLNSAGVVPSQVKQIDFSRSDGMMRVSSPAPYYYEFHLPEGEYQGPLCEEPRPDDRLRNLQVHADMDVRVYALAQEIVGPERDPIRKIRKVEEYLRTNHSYSLEADPGPGDPVSDFLLNKRSAHCEFFASSAVILLRCLKIPTRFVVGYYAHESAGDRAMYVRQQDAHAWAESWVAGVGWVTVEATPSDGRPDGQARGIAWWRRAWEWISDTALAIGDWLLTLNGWQIALGVAGLVSMTILVLWLREALVRRRRAIRHVPMYTRGDPAFEAMFERFEAAMKGLGIVCPPNRTWREFLEDLKHAPAPSTAADGEKPPSLTPAQASTVESFLNGYNVGRFGRVETRGDAGKLAEALAELERERKRRS